MKWLIPRVVTVTALLAAIGTVIQAQVPTGAINGMVTDPHDAIVTNAHITTRSKSQGISRESSTNADGLYVFANMPAGAYDVKIEASGFAPTEFTDAVVQ